MGSTQVLMCLVLLLLLVAKHEVQADTPCARQCPSECEKMGNFGFQCYLSCVKHCEAKTFGKKDAKLSKEEIDNLSQEEESKISEIEQKLISTPATEFHDHDRTKLSKASNASAETSKQEIKKQGKETDKKSDETSEKETAESEKKKQE